MPHLSGLEELDVSATRSQSLGVQALMRSGFGANLTRLVASASRVRVAGFEAVAASGRRLVELDLSNNPARGGLGHLARSEHMGRLERLDVSATQSDGSDLLELGSSGGFGELKSLNLSGNRLLTNEGMTGFARAGWVSQLEEFRCQRSGYGTRGLSIWLEACGRMNLRVLELDGPRAEDVALAAFARAGHDALRHLVLEVEEMTDDQALVFCGSEWISRLETLRLHGVPLGPLAASSLAERVREGSLARIECRGTGIAPLEALMLDRACSEGGVGESLFMA